MSALLLQIGQCGNQLGTRFWEIAQTEKHSSLFSQGRIPRAIMVDSEEGVLNSCSKSALGALFSEDQILCAPPMDAVGSGNNWAVGFHSFGPMFRERLLVAIDKQLGGVSTIFSLHSLGGGTGSGLGAYAMQLLADEYPKCLNKFSVVILPSSQDSDVVTSPYNSVLSLHHLCQYSDCIIPAENQALFSMASTLSGVNTLVANLLLHITSSMRYPGTLNVDINEIAMNLVPFPRLKLLVASAPQLLKKNIHDMFQGAFTKGQQLIVADPAKHTYFACAVMARGCITITDINENIKRLQKLKFVWWNTEGWKTGLCSVAPFTSRASLVALACNSCIACPLEQLKVRFLKLFKRRANLHHYTEYMESCEFLEALETLQSTIEEYKNIPPAPNVNDWESWARSIITGFN